MCGSPCQPLVSIVIASFNRAQLVARAVRSALAQTYPNVEVIVSDDCSPDDTLAVLARIQDRRLQVHPQAKNLGCWGNWTAAVRLAKGEFLIFLGDDDYITENFVEVHLAAFQKQPEVDVVFSQMQDESPTGEVLGVMDPFIKSGQTAPPAAIVDGLLASRLFFGSAMFRSNTAVATWLTTGPEEIVADWGLLLRLSLIHQVKSTGCSGSNYHKCVHPNRLSSRYVEVTGLLAALYERMGPHCPTAAERARFRRLGSLERITLARHHAADGDLRKCRRELAHSVGLFPWHRAPWGQLLQAYLFPSRIVRTAHAQRFSNKQSSSSSAAGNRVGSTPDSVIR
jgi:hypothetical protein